MVLKFTKQGFHSIALPAVAVSSITASPRGVVCVERQARSRCGWVSFLAKYSTLAAAQFSHDKLQHNHNRVSIICAPRNQGWPQVSAITSINFNFNDILKNHGISGGSSLKFGGGGSLDQDP